MNCERIQPELVTYHFGVIEDGPRREVEEHLFACPGCLRNFLTLKHDIETAELGPRPSPSVLDRLRVSARSELAPRHGSWWERPLAFAFAGAMVLAALAAVSALDQESGRAPQNLNTPPAMSSPALPR